MSPGDMKLERWLVMLQKLVETQVDQGRPPPADIPRQIDYYKDAFRTIHRIAITESDSNPSLDSGQLADVRSVSTPVNSSANTFPRPDSTPASLSQQRYASSGDSAHMALPLERSQSSGASQSIFAPPQLESSVRSPCSAETSGAIGEAPVIIAPVQSRRRSGHDPSAISPSPRRIMEYQIQNTQTSHDSGLVASQNASKTQPHSGMNAMRPPPRRSLPASTVSIQSMDQQVLQQFNSQGDFTLDHMTPMFDSNNTTGLFDFTGMLEGQEASKWQDAQMIEGQTLLPLCQICNGTRTISFNSRVQECSFCAPFYSMQN